MTKEENLNRFSLPQPEDISEKDRENGFGSYIMMFAGTYFPVPFVEIISSLIYYLYFRNKSRYASFHAYQSLLGQIPVTLINGGFFAYAIILLIRLIRDDFLDSALRNRFFIFLALVVLINIIYIIISLYIALKAKKGIICYMPVAGRMAYEKYYGPDAVEIVSSPGKAHINRPPV